MFNVKRLLAIISAICIFFSIAGCGKDEPDNPDIQPGNTVSSTENKTEESDEYEETDSSSSITKKTKPSSSVKSTNEATTVTAATTASEYPYAYAGFNPAVTDMSAPFTEILLNRYYRLPDGYKPKLATAVDGYDAKLDERVAPYYQAMYNAAYADGIRLVPVSGYRSYERQKNNFENRIARYQSQGFTKAEAAVKTSEVILLPGTSEHNAGLAMDICSLETDFDRTEEFRWLQAHAHEYGFIMRYPANKTHITKITYEPWHYRYVGVEIATELKSSGMVLEEYLGKA